MTHPSTRLKHGIEALANDAHKRYIALFDRALFDAATKNRSDKYADDLMTAALALCGDPTQYINRKRRWNDAATEFLARFVPVNL